MRNSFLRYLLISILLIGMGYWVYYQYTHTVKINKITLTSPDNSALKEDIHINLSKASSLFVEYWKSGSSKRYRTPVSKYKIEHTINLLLLEPESTYEYRIVIDRFINTKSEVFLFKTREASPWMVHNWIKEENPHDETALGNGLVMLCYRGYPGYIAMVDGKGTIRWYWQDEKLGVRLASLTPRNTIIALLAPASKDEFHTSINSEEQGFNKYYTRTGKIGFVGGTEIAEIDLKGNVLWRVNLEEQGIIFHHDLRMDKKNQIIGIYRDFKKYDLNDNGSAQDTLWGDGVMVMDTTGKVLKKWSAWDVWDISKDKRIKELSQDRFHFNTVSFDVDSNYLISSPIENQIWKVNASTGKVMWKFGKGGDFKMDTTSYFYFQHASYINHNGNLMLFDNGDFSPNDTTKNNKVSRALSFKLDTVAMEAVTQIKATLPTQYYTSRMGSAYLMPNNHILQTSSKTGGVVITDDKGKVLWALNSHFIPYRAEYVPATIWKNFIQ